MTDVSPNDRERRTVLRQLVGLGALAVAQPWLAHAAPGLPNLRRGLNLTHWFEYEQSKSVSAAEMQMLFTLGFDHVRLPVDPTLGGWMSSGGLQTAFIQRVRQAVELAVAAGLEVVLDVHLQPETKQMIEDESRLESRVLELWSALGQQFADIPATRLAFELLNEPQYYSWRAWRWPGFQQRMFNTLRERLPRHLILLTGNEGGSLKGLQQTPLIKDPSVAYVFHYYDPFLFTHQGADWLDTRYTTAGLYRGIRYPAQYQAATRPTLSRPHPRAAQELSDYIQGDWDAQRVRRDIDAAGEFARRHGVRVVCNEFGVIRANVDRASRYRWIQDVRLALEANGIGWTVWDYKDIFGIADDSRLGNPTAIPMIDPEAIAALGLGKPRATLGGNAHA